ncbi:MAG: hypothetical protein WCO28_10590 [Bacteroidota bacterium]
MATISHFQPWRIKSATDLVGSMRHPTKLFDKLVRDKLIQPVTIYPYSGRFAKQINFFSTKATSLAFRELDHQFGITEILMAFIYSYPEYDIEIEHTPVLKMKEGNYRPDAIVKMTDKNLRNYHFIVEFERSRTAKAIYNEKLVKNERMPSFKELGLSSNTKILYIYAYERFDLRWRPLQYQEPHILEAIDLQNKTTSGDTYINVHVDCPLELDQCIRCTECGRELEDVEDVEDYEE